MPNGCGKRHEVRECDTKAYLLLNASVSWGVPPWPAEQRTSQPSHHSIGVMGRGRSNANLISQNAGGGHEDGKGDYMRSGS